MFIYLPCFTNYTNKYILLQILNQKKNIKNYRNSILELDSRVDQLARAALLTARSWVRIQDFYDMRYMNHL